MGRRTSRRHYSLVNFKSPVGRNHWPSCWHGSYGIIYNPPQSPQPSVDTHRVINTNDIQVMPVYITVKYGEFQANSSSHLETRGLRWHDSANLASFSKFKNPRTMEGKITRSRRLLLYSRKFKGRQKISGLESIWQLQNPGSMKKFRVIRKDSGLKSGSREVSLTEALKYPVYNPVQEKSVLPQSSEALKSGLKMSGSKRN